MNNQNQNSNSNLAELFQELYQIAKLDRQNSLFSQSKTLAEKIVYLHKEVKELQDIKMNDSHDLQHMKEELGDVLWNALGILVIAEEQNYFPPKEVLEGITAKIKYRKPWIFNGETVEMTEEIRRWEEAKKKKY